MAIPYAAVRFMKRSRGHSTEERLAYIGRLQLRSVRTKERFDYRDRSDLVLLETICPSECPEALRDAVGLWGAVEMASRRKDASLGLDLLLALPTARELSEQSCLDLVRGFVREAIVGPHQLGTVLAVHHPHGNEEAEPFGDEFVAGRIVDAFDDAVRVGRLNRHAHIMITPRQIEKTGLHRLRYVNLDVEHRGGKALGGMDWPRLWHRYQNDFFLRQGLELRVRPDPGIPLRQVPLTTVRRGRRKLRQDNPKVAGRALLVNPDRDKAVRERLRSIDAAAGVFDQPFTRSELDDLLLRYFPREIAGELGGAIVGLSDLVKLDVPGQPSSWYVSKDVVIREQRVLGLATALAQRRLPVPGSAQAWLDGLPPHTRSVSQQIIAGPDLTIVQTDRHFHLLQDDLARLAEAGGLVPVCVLGPGGTRLPRSVRLPLDEIKTRMIKGALITLVYPDALTAAELDLLLEASLAGNSKLVLIRPSGSPWRSNGLIDTITARAQVLSWTSDRKAALPRPHPREGLTQALQAMADTERLEFCDSDTAVLDRTITEAISASQTGKKTAVFLQNRRFRGAMQRVLDRHGSDVPPLSNLGDFGGNRILVPVVAETLAGVASALLGTDDLTAAQLLVDRTLAADIGTLADIIYRARHSRTALLQNLAGSSNGSSRLQSFAADQDGDIATSPIAIGEAIAFWSEAPPTSAWTSRLWDHGQLAALLRQGGDRQSTQQAHEATEFIHPATSALRPAPSLTGFDEALEAEAAAEQASEEGTDRQWDEEDAFQEWNDEYDEEWLVSLDMEPASPAHLPDDAAED